jgi:hypothetical protein
MNNNFNLKNSMLMIIFTSVLFPTMLMAQTASGTPDAGQMIVSSSNAINALIKFVEDLAFLTGIILTGFALWECRKIGTPDGRGVGKKAFWMFMIGVLFVNFSGTIDIFTNSLDLGNEEQNVLASSSGSDPSTSMAALATAVLLIVQLIGNICFFRGVWHLKSWSQSNGQMEIWKPFGLIILGSFAINIHTTIQYFANTVGVSLPSWIT